MKNYITALLILANISLIGQSLSDTIVNVLFNSKHDTIIAVKKSKYAREDENLIYYKTYKDKDTTKLPVTEPCYKPYSVKSIKPIIDSLNKIGYMPGNNISENVKICTEILINKETIDKVYGNLYNYNLHRTIILGNDTLYADNDYNIEQRIDPGSDTKDKIAKNITYEVTVWQSKDKKQLYCIFNSGRLEYSNDGNEYYISTTHIAVVN